MQRNVKALEDTNNLHLRCMPYVTLLGSKFYLVDRWTCTHHEDKLGKACTHFKMGILVAAELQVSIALLVVIHMHSLCESVGEQASPHGSEACVGLRHMDASHSDAVSWLDRARQLALQLDVQAAWGGTLRYLHAPTDEAPQGIVSQCQGHALLSFCMQYTTLDIARPTQREGLRAV